MSQAARKGDQHSCPKEEPISHGTGEIVEGSLNVTICDMPAARVGDNIQCQDGSTHAISQNSACVLINDKPAARINDMTAHGGKIVSGAGTVIIEDGPAFVELGDAGAIEIGENVFFRVAAYVEAAAAGIVEAELANPAKVAPWAVAAAAVVGAAAGMYHESQKDSDSKLDTEAGDEVPGPYADNPNEEPEKYEKIKKSRAFENQADGSVWERDHTRHGGDQWKRWPDRKSWEKGNKPNSIWPDGRVRK